VIATGGEGEEGEKVNLKICQASVKGERTDHYTKEDCQQIIEIFHYKY
jgi:hypothetical protein